MNKVDLALRFPRIARAMRVLPRSLVIEPTNRCNVSCFACQRRSLSRPIGDLTLDRFKAIVNAIPTLKRLSLYFMGEPLLNTSLFDMIRHASKRGIKTSIATNSTLIGAHVRDLLDSGLYRLHCSLDGMSQDTLTQYRGGSDFRDVIGGLQRLLAARSLRKGPYPEIILRFLVFRHNEHEVKAAMAFAESHRVRLDLVRPILDWGYESLPSSRRKYLATDPRYQRYNDDGSLRGRLRRCGYVFQPVVTWEGDVAVCCFDVDAKYSMGNVFNTPFESIYWSIKYQRIRRDMMRRQLALCATCKSIRDPYTSLHYEREKNDEKARN